MALLPRQIYGNNNLCYDSIGNEYSCQSSWFTWGRWVALAVILVLVILFFFLCSVLTARRRRRAGRQPYYGTGWASGNRHGPVTYNPNMQSQPPPVYGEQQNGGLYGQNQGYYGGQQTGVEMQPPQNVYNGNNETYQPPTGPPPKKHGGY